MHLLSFAVLPICVFSRLFLQRAFQPPSSDPAHQPLHQSGDFYYAPVDPDCRRGNDSMPLLSVTVSSASKMYSLEPEAAKPTPDPAVQPREAAKDTLDPVAAKALISVPSATVLAPESTPTQSTPEPEAATVTAHPPAAAALMPLAPAVTEDCDDGKAVFGVVGVHDADVPAADADGVTVEEVGSGKESDDASSEGYSSFPGTVAGPAEAQLLGLQE